METEYLLLGYTYYTYCQGTRDRNYGTHLVEIPKMRGSSFYTARETLYGKLHRDGVYEIEIESIKNLTIKF